MIYQFALWMMRLLEGMFFIGLGGCALVVIVSWVSIFAEGFKSDN